MLKGQSHRGSDGKEKKRKRFGAALGGFVRQARYLRETGGSSSSSAVVIGFLPPPPPSFFSLNPASACLLFCLNCACACASARPLHSPLFPYPYLCFPLLLFYSLPLLLLSPTSACVLRSLCVSVVVSLLPVLLYLLPPSTLPFFFSLLPLIVIHLIL